MPQQIVRKKWGKLLFFAAFVLWGGVCAEAQVTAAQLLASAWDDPAILQQRRQQTYLENTDFSMPLLRRLEFRTETRDLDLKQQEYAIRLTTNGLDMKRTQAAIVQAQKERTEAARQILVQQAIFERYELLLDLHFDQKKAALLEAWQQVLLDKKAVFSQQLTLGLEQDLDDFFRTEEDLMQADRQKMELTSERASRRFFTKLFTGMADSVALGSLIDPTVLISMAQFNLETAIPPSVQRDEGRVKLAVLEEEMERAEGHNYLNYFQLRYTGNANDLLEDRFSVGAGINLPWPNAGKLREQELHLKTLEAQVDYVNERQANQRAVMEQVYKTGSLLQQYLLLENQIGSFSQQYSPEDLHASGLQNPETLLRVKETVLKLEFEKLEISKKMYQCYLEMLNEAGLLQQSPAKNWLSPELEPIGR